MRVGKFADSHISSPRFVGEGGPKARIESEIQKVAEVPTAIASYAPETIASSLFDRNQPDETTDRQTEEKPDEKQSRKPAQ